MKKQRRLSRNYSFADKQERTVGRSKVVRKFPCGNFLPPEVKKARYMLPLFWHLQSKCYEHALPRKLVKTARV